MAKPVFVLGSSFLSYNPRGILVLFGAASALKSNPQIPLRPEQENRAHVHEPGQNMRIDQSEV